MTSLYTSHADLGTVCVQVGMGIEACQEENILSGATSSIFASGNPLNDRLHPRYLFRTAMRMDLWIREQLGGAVRIDRI